VCWSSVLEPAGGIVDVMSRWAHGSGCGRLRAVKKPAKEIAVRPNSGSMPNMNSGDWAAIGAVVAGLVAVVALIFSIRSTIASERAAKSAERAAIAAEAQTEIQRQIQVATAQPYIWVDVREDESQGMLLDLVIGNSGSTVATNIRARIDPPLPAHPQLEEGVKAQEQLAEGISSLPPAAMIRWHLGPGFSLIPPAGKQSHQITITADGPFGPIPQLTYVLDLANMRGQPIRPQGSLHLLTKAVERLSNRI